MFKNFYKVLLGYLGLNSSFSHVSFIPIFTFFSVMENKIKIEDKQI